MPFTSTSDLPDRIKKFSTKVQRQWMYVFNTTYSKVMKETGDVKQAEGRAFKAANSVLKKRFSDKQSMLKNTQSDYFNHIVENWLGNLKG